MGIKISVVTATYNSEATIAATLESLKSQCHTNFEHVVVDGLSTDRTIDIVRKAQIDCTLIDSRRDNGIYDALNRGIRLASGDVVGFLHSDDFFPNPEVLGAIAGVFEDPSVDMCFGDLAYVRQFNEKQVVRRWRPGEFRRSRLRFGWMPPHPTVYVRRELLRQYLFNINYRISGDYHLLLRLLSRNSVNAVYIPRELVHMRLGGASNKSVVSTLKKTKEDWQVIRSNALCGLLTLVCKNIRKLPQFVHLKR